MNILNIKKYLPYAIIVIAYLAMILIFAAKAYANPYYTGTQARLSVATSTLVSIAPGKATTTPIYDSYEVGGTNQTNGGTISIPDTVAVLIAGRASSTASVVNVACEFSDNYSTITGNGDWFQNEIYNSTTTGVQNIDVPISYGFTYASSSNQIGGAGLVAGYDQFRKLFQCPAPLRYVRLVISATGATSTVWYAVIPKKQKP